MFLLLLRSIHTLVSWQIRAVYDEISTDRYESFSSKIRKAEASNKSHLISLLSIRDDRDLISDFLKERMAKHCLIHKPHTHTHTSKCWNVDKYYSRKSNIWTSNAELPFITRAGMRQISESVCVSGRAR